MIVTRVQLICRRGALAVASTFVAVVLCPSIDVHADQAKPTEEAVDAELFAAIDAGQIDVKYIPLDATKANVLIKNLTGKPLSLQLPSAFAGVPVLAQGMMGGGMGGMGGGGGAQAGGGGMDGGGMGDFMIPPERMRKVAVKTVCLEHGKQDPNPRMAYKIVPLEQFTTDPRVRVLCEALGKGQVAQNTAQAVAWHMLDGLTWEQLAAKNRSESKYTGNVRWFSPLELRTAIAVVDEVTKLAEASESQYDGDFEG